LLTAIYVAKSKLKGCHADCFLCHHVGHWQQGGTVLICQPGGKAFWSRLAKLRGQLCPPHLGRLENIDQFNAVEKEQRTTSSEGREALT
jgi:hypothetical protein